ncbi:MAG: hypothetical protein J5725_12000 [Bacteroidales bacterium]|nr:hypothetical protein [Bacteroidales bacterium]
MSSRIKNWSEFPVWTAYDPNAGSEIDVLDIKVDTALTDQDEDDLYTTFGVKRADVQSDVVITGTAITGTSNYISEIQRFGLELGHHFLILHITAPSGTTLQASMNPTQQSGLMTLDDTGVVIFQMKDDKSQTVKVVATRGSETLTKEYTITGMAFGDEEFEIAQ